MANRRRTTAMDQTIGPLHDTTSASSVLAGPVIAAVLYALARGVPMERVTEVTGLRGADLLRLDVRLPERHMPALLRLLIETFPGRPIGLEMASTVPFAFMGVLLLSTRHATSLRECLRVVEKYRAVLSSSLMITINESELETRLEIFHPLDDDDLGCASDFTLATAVRYLRKVLGLKDALIRVELAHAPIGEPESYADFFGVDVVFAAQSNALVFRSARLDEPLPHGNRSAFRLVLAHLDRVREHELSRRVNPSLAPIVDAILENAENGLYEVGALARRLALTPRSLQRHVAAQGLTVRSLLDRARKSHALRLLADPQRSVGEVARVLGYAGEASFRRAFRRWTGTSPTEARRRAEMLTDTDNSGLPPRW